MSKMSQWRNERGLALVIVLWVIASAALLVSSFNASVRSATSFVSTEVKYSKIEAVLDAGLELAAARIIDLEESRRWKPDGQPHQIVFAGTRLSIALTDPNSLIDLNKADQQILLKFILQFTKSESDAKYFRDLIIAARVESAADTSTDPAATQAGGNARSDRQLPAQKTTSKRSEKDQSRSTKAADKNPIAFTDISQLRQLDGMNLDLYRQMIPYLTVYSRDGRVNPMTAPKNVLLSLPNLTQSDIERLYLYRRGDQSDKETIAALLQRAAPFLNLEDGPAYIVTVTAETAGIKTKPGKQYIIVTGLDEHAPYRLLSVKPIWPSSL
ncbi:hypothetical protein MnTg02_02518 [bacterium MnTg02]|nr:hypothetical protein MnTg02_02518 [bacterium MnTg02]